MNQAAVLTGYGRACPLILLAALGVFFAADDQTSVVAVLPHMVTDIGLAQDDFYRAAWIVNGYILGYVVAMPLMGRIADSFGHGRVYALALLVFCLGSAWVAVSTDLTLLSIARGVQAVGGGAVVPISMAIVMTSAPPGQRALGLGAMAAASEAGALVGPLWGGGIADLIGWRGVFWINLPMCLPIALALWRLSPASTPYRRPIDIPGALLLGVSLVSLTIALTDDPISPRTTAGTLGLLAAAAVFFALFVLRQLKAPSPVVALSLFRRLPLSAAFVTNTLAGGALIVAMVNVPLFTNLVLGGSPLEGGLNLMRLTLALATGALAGGYLTGRIGPAPIACAGLVLAGAGFLGMSRWPADPSFAELTLPLAVSGLGFGLIIAPINSAALSATAEGERATVASLLTVVRLLGALVAVALLTSRGLSGFYAEAGLIPLDDPNYAELLANLQVDSFSETFFVSALACFATLIPAAFLGRSRE
ncbi:MAG: MFS transporter [Dehalococcoidia bacterium]|nr:MFS transporter [Dehalococcoidia bacterium]